MPIVAIISDFNDNGEAILLTSDVVRLLDSNSRTLRTIADTVGPFRSFSNAAVNNNGEVAFSSILDLGDIGIFTGADPVANKVIATGDSLGASTVTNVSLLRSGFNNNGQIAFFATFSDGSQGIFRADLITNQSPKSVPEGASASGLAAFTVLGLGGLRRQKRRSPLAMHKPRLYSDKCEFCPSLYDESDCKQAKSGIY